MQRRPQEVISMSRPSRTRGLKRVLAADVQAVDGRVLHGRVD